jgi:hypothetical protein
VVGIFNVGALGIPAAERGEPPYLPFVVDHHEPHVRDERDLDPTNAGVAVANGRIPNAEFGGIVLIGGKLAEYDHVVLEDIEGKNLKLAPSSIHDVDHGTVKNSGILALIYEDERVWLEAYYVDRWRNWAEVDNAKRRGEAVHFLGDQAVRLFSSLNADERSLELGDANPRTGAFTVRPPTKLY